MEKKMIFLCNDLQGGGVYVPIGIFPNINIHKNIDYHLKHNFTIYNTIYFTIIYFF